MKSKQIKALILAGRLEEELLHYAHVSAIIREREDAAYHPVFAICPDVPRISNFFRKLWA